MLTALSYRRYAVDCLRILAYTNDPESRAALRAMAIAWFDLAEFVEQQGSPDNLDDPGVPASPATGGP
jgi:hypothetical protein